ncbi:WXG100 family type VII secretion target [Amycolatopsis sp. NPDC057786]|uniref:WXG100 family type VII secretion target n=1 Tax=Amycolatopsis sp. NPDC057786 TaxID=3346250 RepID=UPI00366C53E8
MPLADVGGDTGHDIPSRAEVEKILNDPNIDRDTKRELALNYIDYIEDETPESCGFASEAERNGFRDHIKSMNGDWITEGDLNVNDGSLVEVQAAYKTAHEKYDANQAAGRQGDRDALNRDAAKTQEIAGRATETDPGCANSNDIMVPGLSGFKVYEIFHPLYVRALGLAGGGAAVSLSELQRLYHEQDNIPFNLFKTSAEELTAVGTAVTGSAQDVSGKLGNSLGTWEGAAAEQARAYQKAYSDKTGQVAEAFKAAGDGLLRTTASVGKFCREKVEWLQKWYTDNIDGATAQDIERIIRIADGSCSQNDIIHCIKFLSIEAKDAFNDDAGDIDQSTIDEVLKPQAVAWLKNVFLGWFGKHIENFQLVCKNTRDAINGAWKAYFDSLGQVVENPFADLGKTPETGGEKPVEKPVEKGGGGPPASGGGGPSPGAGGGPGRMTPSNTVLPEPEKPEVPGQEKNPVTDKPLDVDPATGQPYPIDPRTGEAIKDTVRPEPVTVEQGDRKISMAEPGADGKMGISVQDGTGQAKDYDLDFGDGKATPDAAGGPAPRDGAEQLPPATPGPDGKIHIEDGGLKITAERPNGPDGPTLVTVDDGSGQPSKYTLGDDESAGGRHTSPDATPQSGGRHAAAQPVEEQAVRSHDGTSGGVGGGAPAPGQQAEPVTAAGDGDSESTTAQSLSDPFEGEDNGLGATSDPAGTGGGGSAPSTSSGLGSAPGGGAQDPAAAGAGMMGGMGMMGGGAAGGGQGAGEDQQRTSSGYRVDGGLFDTATATGSRISGSLDDDGVIGFR